MKEITCADLKKMLDSQEDFKLIDVREEAESLQASIGGDLIPMNTVPENLELFPKDKKVVVYCRSGNRSGVIINFLEKEHGFTNLYNLKGGIMAYSNEVGL
ncbi:MAG: rhodanese-like domain-containing protein [Bacteroidia bacterium]|jgi:adenylyltransferase/sulfurtransferase|nr:rhodanese-like domain-containing protein [Bacteroidia bacterium]